MSGPTPGGLDMTKAVMGGLEDRLRQVVAERDRYRAERDWLYAELKEAHTWLEGAGIDDCEHRGYEGTKLCRFAEALLNVGGADHA